MQSIHSLSLRSEYVRDYLVFSIRNINVHWYCYTYSVDFMLTQITWAEFTEENWKELNK